MYYFSRNLIVIRLGRYAVKLKKRRDLLFSERHQCNCRVFSLWRGWVLVVMWRIGIHVP